MNQGTKATSLTEFSFKDAGPTDEVFILGDWNRWEPQPMTYNGEYWVFLQDISQGYHEFCFSVNSEMVLSGNNPTTQDNMSNWRIIRTGRAQRIKTRKWANTPDDTSLQQSCSADQDSPATKAPRFKDFITSFLSTQNGNKQAAYNSDDPDASQKVESMQASAKKRSHPKRRKYYDSDDDDSAKESTIPPPVALKKRQRNWSKVLSVVSLYLVVVLFIYAVFYVTGIHISSQITIVIHRSDFAGPDVVWGAAAGSQTLS